MKDIGKAKHFSEEDLRFATPANVAEYRAKRLKCNILVDLCSGIGIQSGAFAKNCKEVYGFEIDERKVDYANKNFKNIKNLKFETGDILDKETIEKIKKIKPDIIFCDPERLPSEKERNLSTIQPDIKKLIEIYSKITPNLCIEVPPQISIEKLNELGICEKEYLSVNNKLNRLNLYFGNLKKSNISVIDVDSEESIESKKINARKVSKILNYIFEISSAITKAGLENEFAIKINAYILESCEKNRTLLTSDKLFRSSLCKSYKKIGVANNTFELTRLLKTNYFGKVVIKYSVDPKDYWKERNKLESGLIGKKEAVVFKINQDYLVCEGYD